MNKKILIIGIILILIIVGIVFINGCAQEKSSNGCIIDSDCVVFGKTGDCNCGCYNENNLPTGTSGKCFCAAPTSCKCVTNKCEGIFEEEFCGEMSLTEAKQIAIDSECGNNLKNTYFCNENTGTWWIDLDIEKELCNPACVINIENREANINWRCTGAVPE